MEEIERGLIESYIDSQRTVERAKAMINYGAEGFSVKYLNAVVKANEILLKAASEEMVEKRIPSKLCEEYKHYLFPDDSGCLKNEVKHGNKAGESDDKKTVKVKYSIKGDTVEDIAKMFYNVVDRLLKEVDKDAEVKKDNTKF